MVTAMSFIYWRNIGSPHNIGYPYNLAGLPLIITGMAMGLWGKRLFHRLDINIRPFHEPDRLVTAGLYQYTRNPMYLGLLVALLGIAVLSQGAILSFVLVLSFWLICDRWYIQYEESAMRKLFAVEYEQYCKNTPRWI